MAIRRDSSSAHRLLGLCALLLSLAGLLLAGAPSATATPAAAVPPAAAGGDVGDFGDSSARASAQAEQPLDAPSRCSGTLPAPDPALAPAPTPEPGHTPSAAGASTACAAPPGADGRGTPNGWRDRPAVPLSQLSVLRI